MSRERLVELCGLSPIYITDIERGLHCTTIDKLEIIAKSLNVGLFILLMNIERNKDIVNKSRQYNQDNK